MKTLIIDDDINKTNRIIKTLNSLGISDIQTADCQNEGMRKLINEEKSNEKPFELLILDMQFPLFSNEIPNIDGGRTLLNYLSKISSYENIYNNLNIIMCSSENTESLIEEYTQVKASVLCSSFVDILSPFEEALKKVREV